MQILDFLLCFYVLSLKFYIAALFHPFKTRLPTKNNLKGKEHGLAGFPGMSFTAK